jgi:Serine dehydrogenase proteinase
MARSQRKKQIEELEAARNGRRVIVYVTGDRQPNLGAQIAFDVFPLMFELLSKIGPVPVLDLFIYSTGGMTMAAWGLANLLREFADSFSVLVPFRALSTATLIALGANEIVMSRLGQLSPVDPSVNTPFNPPAPQQPGAPPGFLPVSVEDVRGFLDLARSESEGKLKSEEALAEVFSRLAADVRPMALGNVYRAKEQIKLLTEQLLKLHVPEAAHGRIGPIVETFTKKLFSHDYLIGRKEAKRLIGPEVVDASLAVETAMMSLYKSYAEDMELSTIFNAEGALGNASAKVVNFRRAYIESADGCYVFKTTQHLQRIQVQPAPNMPPVVGINARPMGDGWERED